VVSIALARSFELLVITAENQHNRRLVVTARPLQKLQEDLAHALIQLDDAVTELADAERNCDIATLIAARVSLDFASVLRLLEASTEEPVAMLCRAAGLSVNGYSAVLRMRRRMRRTATTPASRLLGAYRQLPKATARDLGALLQAADGSPTGRT